MKAKKITSLLLSLLMLASLLTAVSIPSVSAATVISNESPVILASVGDTVTLSNYTVTFDDGTAAAGASWKLGTKSVTSLPCNTAGVAELTATYGGKTKTVYLVIKEKAESEYVLYETDFSEFSTISELKLGGWTLGAADSYYALKNGALVIGSDSNDYVRAFLPSWLGDFGNYEISAEVKMLTTMNNSRWGAIAYRIQNPSSGAYPYYHMCVRENTTSANGIEFAERTAANAWNVIHTASYDVSSMKDASHTLDVQAYGSTVQYNIDGDEVLYVTDAASYKKGQIGLTMNYGTLAVYNIKITVQDSTPVRPAKKLDLINNKVDDLNLINATANVQLVPTTAVSSFLAGSSFPGNAILAIAGSSSSVFADAMTKLASNNCIPGFRITTEAQADAVVAAMNSTGLKDVYVVSSDAALLKYARAKKNILRAVFICETMKSTLTSKEADAIRCEVRASGATAVIVSGDSCSKQAVSELQQLSVAVWGMLENDKSSVGIARVVAAGCNGIISTNAGETAATINSLFAANSMTRTPLIIGHRGNPTQAPENSLLSYTTAYANGADVVEIDIYLTKDKEVVIMHDTTINRTSNGSGTVTAMTLAELKQYYLKNPNGTVSDQKIPTLRELFDIFKDIDDCRIFIEVKGSDSNCVVQAAKIIKEYDMTDRVNFISFGSNFLNQARVSLPGMSTGYLLSPSGTAGTAEDALAVFYTQLASAQSCNSTVNISNGPATSYYMQAATDRGMTVWPWTYSLSNNNAGFLACSDGITTNDCQWAREMYKYISCRSIFVASDGTASIAATGTTYGGRTSVLETAGITVKILDGSDKISVSNGQVTALADGTATILIGYSTKTTSGSTYVLYTDPIKVYVGDVSELTFVEGSSYSESGGYIFGVLPGTTVDDFLAEIVNPGAELTTPGGSTISGSDLIVNGGGLKVNGIGYGIIVKGDINGDGKLTATDYIMCKRNVLGTYSFTELQSLAADIDGNGKNGSTDYIMLKRAVLGTYKLK